MEVRQQIRQFLESEILYVEDSFSYNDDTSFIAEGLIDSMGVMELVAYTQSRFGIRVDERDVTPENFDSISKLAAYIDRKRQAA